MKFLGFFIIYIVSFVILYWIIKEIDICNKLFGKYRHCKKHNTSVFLTIFLSALPFESAKQLSNMEYGYPNYFSSIIGALAWAFYINIARIYIIDAK